MDDYTPDEREVRMAYNHWGRYPELAPNDFNVTGDEFDRWLRQVKADAWDEGSTNEKDTRHNRNPYRITEENN